MSKTILHIAEASGGVERYLVALLTKMKKNPDFEHILVCSVSFDQKKFQGLVKSLVVINEMRNAISLNDVKAIISVRRVIKQYNPDIIYCHSSKAGAIGRVANIAIKNKLIYNAHGWSFNIRNLNICKIKFYEFIERLLSPLADVVVCISDFEKKAALEHMICHEDKLVVINNGVDFDECVISSKKSRCELNIPNDAFVVGAIGRISPQKAPDVFVDMAIEVKQAIPNAFFVIVGDDICDGSFRNEIEHKIKIAGLGESFIITGWVDDPLTYASVFDVATLLSRWEGFGLVLCEYMLMGKPIVATKVDAIPYVVGDAGLLVDVDNYKQAAMSVIRFHDDEELRNQTIKNGKIRLHLFDVQRTASEHIALFDKLNN